MNIFIPIISSVLFWLGGRDQMSVPWNQKLFRWLMGIPIGIISAIIVHSWLPLFGIITYFLATNVMGYGENHPLRKWFGKDIQWILYGFFFGLASLFSLSWYAILQAVLSASCSWVLLKWSNDGFKCNKLNHNFVEIGIGLLGTIGYIWLK